MTGARFTVVAATVSVEQAGKLRTIEVAGGFDQVRTQDQARTVGRAIGEALADNLIRRLQHGEILS